MKTNESKTDESGTFINELNRPRNPQMEQSVRNFNRRKRSGGDSSEKYQRRLASVGGDHEFCKTVYGEAGEYPAFE